MNATIEQFVVIFLGIFYEAVPFLTIGALVSAGIHLFIDPVWLMAKIPRNRTLAALAGGLIGLFFPVCECGSVPAARSFINRGAPAPFGYAFALAAPVINPIVLISTSVAFVGVTGWGFVWWRICLTLFVAVITARFLPLQASQPGVADHSHTHTDDELPVLAWLRHASTDWLDMVRFLVFGAALAAAVQVFVPNGWYVALTDNPWLAVPAMMALAVIMAICSTVDAFVGLALLRTIAPNAVLAFLVFGPMIDLKSIPMFIGAFGTRVTVRMIALTAILTATACLIIGALGWV
ncbi:MAG: permease [Roseiflexaceae bacterium]